MVAIESKLERALFFAATVLTCSNEGVKALHLFNALWVQVVGKNKPFAATSLFIYKLHKNLYVFFIHFNGSNMCRYATRISCVTYHSKGRALVFKLYFSSNYEQFWKWIVIIIIIIMTIITGTNKKTLRAHARTHAHTANLCKDNNRMFISTNCWFITCSCSEICSSLCFITHSNAFCYSFGENPLNMCRQNAFNEMHLWLSVQ